MVGGFWGRYGELPPNFGASLSRDFYLSDGEGSICATSELGVNSRKYHGLLSFSQSGNPSDARLLLSKIEDTVVSEDGARFPLSSNCYPGTVHPDGHKRISRFSFDGIHALWHYEISMPGGHAFEIQKSVCMPRQSGGVCISYSMPHSESAPESVRLELVPLVSGRELKGLGLPAQKYSHSSRGADFSKPFAWRLHSSNARFTHRPLTYHNFRYPLEELRGEGAEEDLFSPGFFEAGLHPGANVEVAAHGHGRGGFGMAESPDALGQRRRLLLSAFYSHNNFPALPHLEPLVLAGDSFVTKFQGQHSIIAGFPYFGIWGRDTFISLPGIAMVTGRHALARDVIWGMLQYEYMGLLPNYFNANGAPSYDSADASLFAIWAIWQLEREGGLRQEDRLAWWKPLRSIAFNYLKGTKLSSCGEDGLISLHGARSTWMDAAIDGEAVTPRAGRRIEINALWVFGLKYLSDFALAANDSLSSSRLSDAHALASSSFREFFNEYAGYFDDGIQPTDGALRPNQLFALALPHTGVSPLCAKSALASVRAHLLTPYGLRTLAPSDHNYHPHYGGAQRERDSAYHQGTVWPWLLGAYADAILLHAPERAGETLHLLNHVINDERGAYGTISELYDATGLTPAGCLSQAWSVGEVLRASVLLYRAKYLPGRLPKLLGGHFAH